MSGGVNFSAVTIGHFVGEELCCVEMVVQGVSGCGPDERVDCQVLPSLF